MTNPPRLRLLSRPPPVDTHTPLHTDVDSARLWDLIKDSTVHTVLKRSALKELARRRDADLIDHCENLITSDTRNDWCLGVDTLAEVGTPDALDRLISTFARSLGDDRHYVLLAVAAILTADYVKPFSIMVRELACPGEIDVTGWTRVAISTLVAVCKRFGVEVESQSAESALKGAKTSAETEKRHTAFY